MAPVIFAVSDGPSVGVPRVNFVAIAILIASAGAGDIRMAGHRAAWSCRLPSSRSAWC